MKRFLLIFALLFCFSCSEDDEEIVDKDQVKIWTVSTKNSCDFGDEGPMYCVSEEVHQEVSRKIEIQWNTGICEEISFEDINGNEITSIILGTGSRLLPETTSFCQ